jgi:hypothetical protein
VRAGFVLAGAIAAVLVIGCAGDGPQPDEHYGTTPMSDAALVEFHQRADAFYGRFAQRRVNVHATYVDPALRDYFRTEKAFADYYAILAQALADAHFARNRPLEAEVDEFMLDGPGRARVRFRLRGDNGLPLRFWSTSIEREDVWQREDGRWWIVPGKL